ncbi:MAG: Ig-like domain repeat protein [Candidatus Sulfotelmatobacter sp.]
MTASGHTQSVTAQIRLEPQAASQIQMDGMSEREQKMLASMPANFHFFGVAGNGKVTEPQALTLHFATTTQITKISSTPDFKVVSGGTCVSDRLYLQSESCNLLVAFTPQGAGHRLGKVTITHTAGEPVSFGLLGNVNFPTVSFIPSLITTVPATVSGGAGLINGAINLNIDNGDSLYIADTGNGAIRYIDSSGVMRSLATGFTDPVGIAVDTFGEVYFSETSQNALFEIFDYGPVVHINGTGTDSCTASSPCYLEEETLSSPGQLSIDPYNNLFFTNGVSGAALATVQPVPATFFNLYDPFPYQTITVGPIAVDSGDNLYSLWSPGGGGAENCEIVAETLYAAENSLVTFNQVAGGRTCGYSGDGGRASGAEIGAVVGQMFFDVAGDLYFSDTENNRVRRVDAGTGIIRTIAGTGATGYKGDNGPATGAALGSPTGIAVDSQGQVYILTPSGTTTAQVVRKVETTGALVFASRAAGTASPAQILHVTNTGNATLTFLRDTVSGTNAGDFTADPNTTSCNFTAGNYLYPGNTCQIGVIFKPVAAGSPVATLTLVDNTVNGVNTVKLSGTATAAAIVKFTTPTADKLIPAGSDVAIAVAVTATGGPAPTGKVDFSVDGKFLASAVLASGTASVNAGVLASGKHQIAASYLGDKYHPLEKSIETITVQK